MKSLKKFGNKMDNDDVRHAIAVACDLDCPIASYNCKLALAPFLLKDNFAQLLGPTEQCDCDKRCPLPVALACASKVAECFDKFKHNFKSKGCQSCIDNVGHQCCPCLAYGSGIIHNRLTGEKIREECPEAPPPPKLCDNPACEDCTSNCENCDAANKEDGHHHHESMRSKLREKMQKNFDDSY